MSDIDMNAFITWHGRPLEDLSKEELIEVIRWRERDRQREQKWREAEAEFRRDFNKAQSGRLWFG